MRFRCKSRRVVSRDAAVVLQYVAQFRRVCQTNDHPEVLARVRISHVRGSRISKDLACAGTS